MLVLLEYFIKHELKQLLLFLHSTYNLDLLPATQLHIYLPTVEKQSKLY